MIKWFKRILLFLLMAIIASFALAFIFISPITKYLIEKYDKEYTNREITIDKLWINLFTGSVRITGLTVYEENDKDKFCSADEIYANIEEHKLLTGQFEITEAYFKKFACTVIQDGRKFNFDDVIKQFSSVPEPKNKIKEPVKYRLENLKLINNSITYFNKQIGNKIEITNLNVSTGLIAWDKNDLLFDLSWLFKTGGAVIGNFGINTSSLVYYVNADVKQFDLHAWYPYLKDVMHTKALEGNISTNLTLKGNLNEPEAVAAKGKFNVSDFSVVDPLGNPLMKCKSLDIGIDSINVKSGLYNLQNISLTEPFLLFEMYDNGNNFYRLLNDTSISAATIIETGQEEANLFTMMAGYVQDITKNYVVASYGSNNFILDNGHLVFSDYTMHDKFRMDIEALTMNAKNLRSANDRIVMQVTGTMNNSGKLVADLSLNSQDFSEFDFNYTINEMRVSDFNPYMVHYVAFPFLDGIVAFKSTNSIKNHFLKSSNDLRVLSVDLGNKVNRTPLYELPMKLAICLLKDPKGNIKLNIPVEGDLNDPKYKIGKVIWQIVKNILIKAATAPYKLLASMFGGKEEEMKEIKFEYMQSTISNDQLGRLDMVAKVLEQKPELKVELVQVNNTEMEKEFYAVFEAKKHFYFSKSGGSEQDSMSNELRNAIKQVDIHDSTFVLFVNSKVTGTDAFTPIQDKCRKIIGEEALQNYISERMQFRNNVVSNYLQNVKHIPPGRLRVINTPDQKTANTQTVSKYLINYHVDDEQVKKAESNN